MILFDGRLNGTLEPGAVSVYVRAVKLIVNLKCHVSEEWGLSSTEVVTSTSVQNLTIVLDLKNEMIHHALGHADLAVN